MVRSNITRTCRLVANIVAGATFVVMVAFWTAFFFNCGSGAHLHPVERAALWATMVTLCVISSAFFPFAMWSLTEALTDEDAY